MKKWTNFHYPLKKEYSLTRELISKAIIAFWYKEVEKINNDQHVICLFRIVNNQNIIRTIGFLQKLNKTDKDFYIRYIEKFLTIKIEEYNDMVINEFIISFAVRKGTVKDEDRDETSASQTISNAKSEIKFQFYALIDINYQLLLIL
jgi:hypothetical protein